MHVVYVKYGTFLSACSIGEKYAEIAEKALTVPQDTMELVALIEYVHSVESDLIYTLEDQLREVNRYMLFLADYTTYSPLEIKQNTTTYNWYNKMSAIFDEHRAMVEQKTLEFQELLKVRFGERGFVHKKMGFTP